MFSNHNLIDIKKYSVHVEDSEDNLQKRLVFKNLFWRGKQLNDYRWCKSKIRKYYRWYALNQQTSRVFDATGINVCNNNTNSANKTVTSRTLKK